MNRILRRRRDFLGNAPPIRRHRGRVKDQRRAPARRWRRLRVEQLEDRSLLAALPPADLVSWWRAENNASDFVGGNNGALVGGATFATGEVGQGFRFDGVGDFVQVPDSASLDITSQITIEGWIMPRALGSNLGTTFVALKGDNLNRNTQSYGFVWGADGRISLRVGSTTDIDQVSSNAALPLNVFSHVAGTYDGTTLSLYVNGVLNSSHTTSLGPLQNTALPLVIGSSLRGGGPGDVFAGNVDELSIYRRALSASEIRDVASAGSEGKATVVVTTSADTVDPSDGVTSFREAINFANAAPGRDVIGFNIPGSGVHTISPTTALPQISDPVVINGYSQPGNGGAAASANTNGPGLGSNANLLIELDGTSAGRGARGLVVTAGNSTIRGLVINRFNADGILLASSGNVIAGNFIGTSAAGDADLGNGASGVDITNNNGPIVDASHNTVGGTLAADRNLISGNNNSGVSIIAFDFNNHPNRTITDTKVQGNLIGTDKTGTAAIGNSGGINLQAFSFGQVTGTTIGGTTAVARNVISGNAGSANISVSASGGGSVTENSIQGNFIGIDVTGTVGLAVGNANGVNLSTGSSNNLIGGDDAADGVVDGIVGAANVISGNPGGGAGVVIDGGTSGNHVEGNRIGTNAAGTAAIPNGIGVLINLGAAGNFVGGATAGAGNLISGNTGFFGTGVLLRGNSDNNVVQGNRIGTDVTGANPLPNSSLGVDVIEGSDNNLIGGTGTGEGNVIAFNNLRGVGIGGFSTGNSILGNSIFSNSQLGIDLGDNGVTENDPNASFSCPAGQPDCDTGANNLQNFPVITAVSSIGDNTNIAGSLNSTPNSTFRIELFANDAADVSGFGEGQFFQSATNVVTDASGNATFSVTVPGDRRGKSLTATATNIATGDTSEFSHVSQALKTVTWDGGGTTSNWSDRFNWSGDAVPGVTDLAVIDQPGTFTVTLDTNTSIGGLKLGGTSGTQTLDAGTHTLTVNGGAQVLSHGAIFFGNAQIVGDLTNAGTLNVNNGTISGTLLNQANATINIGSFNFCAGTGVLTVGNGFTNQGQISLQTSFSCGSSGAGFVIVTNGTLLNDTTGTIQTSGPGSATSLLQAPVDNRGTIQADQPLSINMVSAQHQNSGTIKAFSDLLIQQTGDGSFTSTGTLDVAAGKTLTVNNGTFNYDAGSLTGAGSLSFTNVKANFTPDFTTDTLGLSLSSSPLNGPGAITVGSHGLTLASSTVTKNVTDNGPLNVSGDSTVNGAFSIGTTGVLTIGGFGFPCASSGQLTVADSFTNQGQISLRSNSSCGSPSSGNLTVTSGTLVNAAGAMIQSTGVPGPESQIQAELDNRGTIQVDQPLAINKPHADNQPDAHHQNSGTITIKAQSALRIQQAAAGLFTNTGTINVLKEGTKQGTLTVNGGVFHHQSGALGGDGALIFSSTLEITPDYTNNSFISLRGATVTGAGKLTNASILQAITGASTIEIPFANATGGSLTVSGIGGCGFGSAATLTVASTFTNAGDLLLNTQGNTCGTGDGSATLNVTSGSLVNTGTITSRADNTNGSNTLGANLNNQGTLDVVGADLRIVGSMVNLDSSKIAVGINGPASSQFSEIVVTGVAGLGGTLAVTRASDFTPSPGSEFKIITGGSRSGDFTTFTGTKIAEDRFFKPQPESTAYTLVVDAAVEWDGNTDGDGDGITWQDPHNWSTDQVPGPGDLARIALSQTTLVRLSADTTIGALEIGSGPTGSGIQALNLEGHFLTVGQSTIVHEHGLLSGQGGEFLLSPTVDVLGGKIVDDGIVIAGNVTNAGEMVLSAIGSPGISSVSITGTYTQTAAGTLEVFASGVTAPGLDYGFLTVVGTASLGGKLELNLSSPLQESSLPDGASLTVLKGTNSGQFAETTRLEDGRAFVPRYDSNQVVIQLGRKAVWDGEGDNSTWEDNRNWNKDQVPRPQDRVEITRNGDFQVVLNGDVKIGALLVGGDPNSHQILNLNATFLTVEQGTRVVGAGQIELEGGTLIGPTHLQGGVLSGSGVVQGSLDNNGVLQPGRSLILGDSYSQSFGGRLLIDIDGVHSEQDFDHIAIVGQANLSGSLEISKSAFVPEIGARFDIITMVGAVSGDFTSLTGVVIAPDRFFKPHLESNAYALTVEPAAARLVSWDGGGDNVHWEDARNWSGDQLPGLGDQVEIAFIPGTVVLLGEDTSIGALTIGSGATGNNVQGLSLGGHTLTVASATTVRDHGLLLSGKVEETGVGGVLRSPTVDLVGGQLRGVMTIVGDVTNAGVVELLGRGDPGLPDLVVDGTYTQTAAGTLEMVVSGTTRGVDYGFLAVSSDHIALLAGTVQVVVPSSFDGSSLPDNASLTAVVAFNDGEFAETEARLADGREFVPRYDPDGVVVQLGRTVRWDAEGDKTTWEDRQNWSGDQVPRPQDRVEITRDGEYQVVLNGNAGIGALVVGGSSDSHPLLKLNGNQLDVAQNTTVVGDGTILLQLGELVGRTEVLSGTLIGPGVIAGSLSNSGNVSPHGILKVLDSYSQFSDGTLLIDIEGDILGDEYAQLEVDQAFSLEGELLIARKTSFVPDIGSRFNIITFPPGSSLPDIHQTAINEDLFFAPHLELDTLALVVEATGTHDVSWDGGGDNLTWEDRRNWSGDQVPGLGDRAHIAVGNDTVVLLGEDTAVGALEVGAGATGTGLQALSLGGHTLTVAQGTTVLEHGSLQPGGIEGKLVSPTVDLLGGRLRGTGTIAGNVTNAGTVELIASGVAALPSLGVEGAYAQTAAGTMEVLVSSAFSDGSQRGEAYGFLGVKDTATLAGKLQVVLSSSVEDSSLPDNASLAALVTLAARNGEFAETQPRLDDGRAFVPRYDPDDVVIQLGRTAVWDGAGDGTTWEDAANWTQNKAPRPQDRVEITAAGTFEVHVNADATIGALVVGGAASQPLLALAGRQLEVVRGARVVGAGLITLEDGVLDGSIDLTEGRLRGPGTVSGSLSNSGLVQLEQTLNVLGSYSQSTEGRLLIDINGVDDSTEHGQLLVIGEADLGGSLELNVTDPTAIPDGVQIDTIVGIPRSGQFETVTGAVLDDGRRLTPIYGLNDVKLRVIQPGSESEETKSAVSSTNDGLSSFGGQDGSLSKWGSLFNLDSWTPASGGSPLRPSDLSILTHSLSDAFQLGGSNGILAGIRLPTLDPASAADGQIDTLSELIAALKNIPGIHIDTVRDGQDGFSPSPLPTDLFQATFSTSLADLVDQDEQYNDSSTALDHLAASVGLDGLLDWLGQIHVDLSFGVDDQGFYLRGNSGLTLTVHASSCDPTSPLLTGSADIGSIGGWDLGACVSGNLDVALRPGVPNVRLRPADLAGAATNYLVPTASGSLTLDVTSSLPGFDFDWQGTYAFQLSGLTVTTSLTESLKGHLSLPQLTPPSIDFIGTLNQDTWTLGLAPGSPNDFKLGGFDLNDVAATIHVARDHFDGSIGGNITVALCSNKPPIPVAVSTNFDTLSLHLTATTPLDDCYVGAPAVLWIDKEQLKLDLNVQFGNFSLETDTLSLDPLKKSTGVAVVLPTSVAPPGQKPNGLAIATGLAGSIDGEGNVQLSFDTLHSDLSNVSKFDASGGSLTAGPDAGSAPLVAVDHATLEVQLINRPVDVVIDGFKVAQNGDVTFTHAGLRGDDLFNTFSLGEIVKVKLTGVDIFGLPDADNNILPVRLDRFRLKVQGDVSFEALQFVLQTDPDPSLTIGRPNQQPSLVLSKQQTHVDLNFIDNQGDLSVDLDGPVQLAVKGLKFDPISTDLDFNLGRFEHGKYVFDGTCAGFDLDLDLSNAEVHNADAGASFDPPSGHGQICFDQQTGETSVDFAVTFGFHFHVGDTQSAGLRVDPATATLDLGLTLGPNFDVVDHHIGLTATADIEVNLGDPAKRLVTLSAHGVEMDFTDPNEHLITIDDDNSFLKVSFPAFSETPLNDLHGEARHFAIGKDFSFIPLPDRPEIPRSGFIATIGVDHLPSPKDLGFPAWFPISIESVEVQFGAEALADVSAIRLLVSGGLNSIPDIWPISAAVDRLPINVKKLAEGNLLEAVESPSGFSIGIDPFKIGESLEVGGKLSLHSVSDPTGCAAPTLYGQIEGVFKMADIGGDITLIVSQYGPVLAQINIPVAVPIGPTGLVLTGVGGGIAFGPAAARFPVVQVPDDANADEVRDIVINQLLHPEQSHPADTSVNPVAFDETIFKGDLLKLARLNESSSTTGQRCDASQPAPVYTWDQGFTMALAGHFTTIVSPGVFTGDLSLAAQVTQQPTSEKYPLGVSVKFLGSGVAQVWGMNVGHVGALLDMSNPLAPQYDFAFQGPDPASPLAVFAPARAEYVVHLDTTGIAQAALLGAQTLLGKLSDGTLELGLKPIADALDADRTRPLARLLHLVPPDLDLHTPITAELLQSRLNGLFTSTVDDLATLDIGHSAEVFAALLQEVYRAVQSLTDQQKADFLGHLATILGNAGIEALDSAAEVFKPRFVMSLSIQPTILGIPFGDELLNADIAIDKTGVFVSFDASLHDMTAKMANLIAPFGLGEFLFDVVSLGISDRLHYDLKLPMSGIFHTLHATGNLPPIDLFGNWVGGFTGEIRWLGFSLGQVSGYLFAPNSKTEVDQRVYPFDDSTTSFPDPVPPLDPVTHKVTDTLKIPISSKCDPDDPNRCDLHNLETYGGLIATARTFLPAVLADPIGLLKQMNDAGLFTISSDADFQTFIDTIEGVAAGLGASQEVGRMQLYIPTPGSPPSAQAWAEAAYLKGFIDSKLLGIEIARMNVVADARGLTISADSPFLAGAHVDATVDFNENVNVNQAVEQFGNLIGLDLNLSNSPTTVVIPRVRLHASLDDDELANVLQAEFKVPANIVFDALDADADIQFFSPLYGFGNSTLSEPERNGGVIMDAHLSLLNLIENAQFHFEASLPESGLFPDFSASADLADHLVIPGIGIPDGQIIQQNLHGQLRKQSGQLNLAISGQLGLLGLIQFDASGTLGLNASGLFGDISLGLHNGDLANGFFDFDGKYSLQINTTNQQQPVDNPRIPAGPYFNIHVGASDGSNLPATVKLLKSIPAVEQFDLGGTFDATISEEGFSIDATGHLDIGISVKDLLPDPLKPLVDAANLFGSFFDPPIVFDPLTISGDVTAHLAEIDGRIEGSIGTAPGDDGFQDGDFKLALSRWGCLQLQFYKEDSGSFEPSPLAVPIFSSDACNEHVFVDNQRKGEPDGDESTTTDGDLSTNIRIGLSRETEQLLRVRYTLVDGSASEGDDFTDDGSGVIFINPGKSSGKIPITIKGNNLDDGDRSFTVNITSADYVTDDDNHDVICDFFSGCVAPFSPGDGSARFTIVDDDLGPPPVNIVIATPTNVASQTFQDGIDTVLSAAVKEGGGFSFTVRAENLDPLDSVQLAYHLRPLDPSLKTATLGSDFFAEAPGQGSSGVITLIGSTPKTIHITTTQDTRYELNEQFEIEFEIIQPAHLAADTDLAVNLARVTINNDDSDVPAGALVFYDFDTVAPGGKPYVYDNRGDHVDPRVWATPLEHRDDQSNRALLFDGTGDQVVAPTGSPTVALPTSQFSVDFWMNSEQTTGQGTILALGGPPQVLGDGLRIFLDNGQIKYSLRNTANQIFIGTFGSLTPGQWQHVALVYRPDPLVTGNVILGFLDNQPPTLKAASGLLNVGVAKFSLGSKPDGSSSYLGLLDEFHLWNRALSPTEVTQLMTTSVQGNELGLLVDYRFDEQIGETINDQTGHGWNGRLGTLFASLNVARANPLVGPLPLLGPTGRPDRIEVTDSPVAHLTRYLSPADPNGVPKVAPVAPPSDPTSAITSVKWATKDQPLDSAPYYHFMVGVDATQTGGVFDPSRMVAIHINGVDFFERAGGNGPTRWELRSSADGFAKPIASGETAPGEDYQHRIVRFANSVSFAQSFLHPTQPIEFRLYGLDATGGSWAIDDFALIAGLASPAIFDLPPTTPPTTPPQVVTTVAGNATPPFNPAVGVSDANGDPLAITSATVLPAPGALTRNAAGQYQFTPAAGQTGNVPLSFTIMDRWGLQTTSSVTVNVLAGAVNDAYTIDEDTLLTTNVRINDQFPAGQSPTVSLVGSAPPATQFSLGSNGALTFRPVANAAGTVRFTYRLTGTNFSSDATVTINISPLPDPPIVNADGLIDSYRTPFGLMLLVPAGCTTKAPIMCGVLANDTDPDGDPLTAVLVTPPSSGTLTLFGNGAFNYQPNTGFAGTVGFTYAARDPSGRTTQAAATIVVDANRPPTAGNFTISPNPAEDSSATVPASSLVAASSDPEGGPLRVTAVGAPAHGTVTTVMSGTAITSVTYTPATNYFGNDQFSYTITDSGGLTASALVLVTVTPVNDPPTATLDVYPLELATSHTLTVPSGCTSSQPILCGVLNNDLDIDGDTKTAVLDSPSFPELTFHSDGSFTYIFRGVIPTDGFNYHVVDPSGASSPSVHVTIQIIPPRPSLPTTPPPTSPPPVGGGGSGGVTGIPVSIRKGFVADAVVFFDADFDAIRDFVDANGNGVADLGESAEPLAITDATGATTLVIPNTFDTDGSGFFEPAEGVLVSIGGIVASTTQPLVFPLRATLGARVITPLTSLVTSLVLDGAISAADAQDRVLAGLDLPAFDLLGLDPIAETAAGNSTAPAILAAHSAVANAYLEISSLLAAASDRSNSAIGLAVMSALAEQLMPTDSHLDLRNAGQVADIVSSAASRLGIALSSDAIQATATVVVATSQAAYAVPLATGIGFIEALTRIESAAQGAVSAKLTALASGRVSLAEVINQSTGSALNALIAAAPLGPLVPTAANHLLTNLYATPAIEGGDTTLFGTITADGGSGTRSLLINWGDGAVEQVALAAGASKFRVDHAYADDGPLGTPMDAIPIGVVLLVDSHAVDAAPVSVNVTNIAPQFDTLATTPLAVSGGLASISAIVSDIGQLDFLTLNVDWGDGYTLIEPVTAGRPGISLQHIYSTPGRFNIALTVSDDDGGSSSQTRSIDVIAPTSPAIQSIQVGDGTSQRSMVSGAVVVFNQPVSWDAADAMLVCNSGILHGQNSAAPGNRCGSARAPANGAIYIVAADNPSHDGRTYVVSFAGPNMIGGSLPDGRYTLTIPAASVTDSKGVSMTTDFAVSFYRLFGDGDGDGDVDKLNRTQFTQALGSTQFQPAYRSFFDYDASGRIDNTDKAAFNRNFNLSVLNTSPKIQVAKSSVAVNEGQVATNRGTFRDLDSQSVIVSASLGTITQKDGGWTWSYVAGDDLATTILISATDNEHAVSVVSFRLKVKNVAPNAIDTKFQLPENSPRGNSVGVVTATDPSSDTLSYGIVGGTGASAFAINASTGEITVADASQLDFEKTRSFKLKVKVSDDDGGSDTADVAIDLLNAPSISGSVFVDANHNGHFDAKEAAIDGVILGLLDERGIPVLDAFGAPRLAQTAHDGHYLFEDVVPGTYRVHKRPVSGFTDGPALLGSLGGKVLGSDTMQLSLQRTDAHDYIFAEIATQLAPGDTAQVGGPGKTKEARS